GAVAEQPYLVGVRQYLSCRVELIVLTQQEAQVVQFGVDELREEVPLARRQVHEALPLRPLVFERALELEPAAEPKGLREAHHRRRRDTQFLGEFSGGGEAAGDRVTEQTIGYLPLTGRERLEVLRDQFGDPTSAPSAQAGLQRFTQ